LGKKGPEYANGPNPPKVRTGSRGFKLLLSVDVTCFTGGVAAMETTEVVGV